MARTVRDSKLDTRDGRLKLKAGRRHWKGIHSGLALCYRRGSQGSGSWSARVLQDTGRYALRALGVADDYADANGGKVLSFAEAQAAALALESATQREEGGLNRKLTIQEAADDYLAWFRSHRKGVGMAESAVRAHIVPAFGNRAVASLKSTELRAWLEKMATRPARLRTGKLAKSLNVRAQAKTADEKRARRASANRIFSVLKAILNRAFHNGAVADDSAWRKVKPFRGADQARIRFLTDGESIRLVNACPKELRALVRAALLTGARWGELAALRASDVNANRATIYIAESKSGRPRHIPLNPEGKDLFGTLVAGKAGDAPVFTRPDGEAWGQNHHVRALNEACRTAKLLPAVTFHELRHTYASHLAQAGIDLLTISKLLGHADTRITARHYAHLADKTLAAAVTKLPSFGPDARGALAEVVRTRAA